MSMGMGHMMGGGGRGGGWGLMRSLRRDQSVTEQKLPPGITRRISTLRQALPSDARRVPRADRRRRRDRRRQPAHLPRDHQRRDHQHSTHLIVLLAVLVGLLAVGRRRALAVERWVSARVGEGLIFDMRSKVFEHVQRMPIAFFTRTQTGALVSRLNNDVLGAQQAFTDTFCSVVGNLIGVGHHAWSSCSSCRGRSPSSPWSSCRCSCSRPAGSGRRLPAHHARALRAQRPDEQHA